jgi:hypothetical protein
MTHSRLIPVTKWNQFHSWPPIGGLRHLIFSRDTNGFSEVLLRPSRTWLIDEDKFFEWLKKKQYQHPLSKRNSEEKKDEKDRLIV